MPPGARNTARGLVTVLPQPKLNSPHIALVGRVRLPQTRAVLIYKSIKPSAPEEEMYSEEGGTRLVWERKVRQQAEAAWRAGSRFVNRSSLYI